MTTTDLHYRLPGDASATTLCGLDAYAEDDDVARTDEAGTATCPECRTAADEDDPAEDDITAPVLSTDEYIRCEHIAQIRLANAGRGLMHTKELVDSGVLPQQSLQAARAEVVAARTALGLVHATPIGTVPSDETRRAMGVPTAQETALLGRVAAGEIRVGSPEDDNQLTAETRLTALDRRLLRNLQDRGLAIPAHSARGEYTPADGWPQPLVLTEDGRDMATALGVEVPR